MHVAPLRAILDSLTQGQPVFSVKNNRLWWNIGFEALILRLMQEIIARAIGMLRAAAQQWLSATVWRTVWSIPLPVVLIIALLLFVLLAIFG